MPEDGRALVAAMLALGEAPEEVDADVQAIGDFLLCDKTFALATLEAVSMMTKVGKWKVPDLTRNCAAALGMLAHVRWRSLETALVSRLPGMALVHVVEAVQYDEPPLPTRMQETLAQSPTQPSPASRPLAIGDAPQGALVPSSAQRRQVPVAQVYASQASQKVVQTRGELAIVLKVGEQIVSIHASPDFPLSVVERTTAACLKRQQLQLSYLGRATRAFKRSTRAATTDAYSANKAAEASIGKERAAKEDENALHVLCDVHGTANVYNKVFGPLDAHVTGAVHTALALRTGPAMGEVSAVSAR